MTLKSDSMHLKIGQLDEEDLHAFKVIFKSLVDTVND
jgi:hypothetical protein